MIKSEKPCKDCKESYFIQNKTHHLCSECVYKKNHGGKSKQEIAREKDSLKFKNVKITFCNKKVGELDWGSNSIKFHTKNMAGFDDTLTSGDESQFELNKINQDKAEQEAIKDFEIENRASFIKYKTLLVQNKPIKKKSKKQTEIDYKYKAVCMDMDYVEEKICSGCGRYQGGDIRLSHSHVISRADCKRIGKPELVYARQNIKYHCMTFGEHKGCHSKWENKHERAELLDYNENMEYIKQHSLELYEKCKVN